MWPLIEQVAPSGLSFYRAVLGRLKALCNKLQCQQQTASDSGMPSKVSSPAYHNICLGAGVFLHGYSTRFVVRVMSELHSCKCSQV